MSSRRIAILTVCAASSLVSDAFKFIDKQVLFHKMCDELADDPDFNIDSSVDLWIQDFTWNSRETPYDLLAFRKVTAKTGEDFLKFGSSTKYSGCAAFGCVSTRSAVRGCVNEAYLLVIKNTFLAHYWWKRFLKARPHANRSTLVSSVKYVEHIRRKSIQLVRFQMLMVGKGRFVVIMECDTGETSLLHRDTLKEVPAELVYSAAAMVPFPVRYSHLYTGIKIPETMKEAMFEPLFLANHETGRPHLEPEDKTSCEEFSRYARFNPYTVLDETWMVFYFWAPQTPTLRVDFTLPRKSDYKLLHDYLDEHVSTPVNWTARHVLIRESGQMSLLVENGDRGQYLMYVPLQGVPEGKKLDPVDVRFKQTGDNEVLGMMLCEPKVGRMSLLLHGVLLLRARAARARQAHAADGQRGGELALPRAQLAV
ncbi:hypothetical protein MSG28_000070 [Choristoneura fumiferana]|uniref:Uncharacterized protein n=1 Tax=Choristoneura fumiferana TaxID=7141 RepID=A0ACC0JZB7_CHOFU|nr:hypothetical protein MSG28_000070 [Choristoneura fumiferana]